MAKRKLPSLEDAWVDFRNAAIAMSAQIEEAVFALADTYSVKPGQTLRQMNHSLVIMDAAVARAVDNANN